MASGKWQWDIDISNVNFTSMEKCPASDLILPRLILCNLQESFILKMLTKEQNHQSPFNYKTEVSAYCWQKKKKKSQYAVTCLKNVLNLCRFIKRHSEIREF